MSKFTWSPHPTTVGEAPFCWYDANDDSSLTEESGSVCSEIRCKVGSGVNPVQATDVDRPDIVSNAVNGLQVLEGTNAGAEFLQASFTDGFMPSSEPLEIFCVCQPRTPESIYKRLFIFHEDSPSQASVGGYFPNNSNLADVSGSSGYYVANTSLSLNTTYIISIRKYPTNLCQVYVNGALATVSSQIVWTYTNPGAGTLTLMNNKDGGPLNFVGYFCELLGYSGDDSTRRGWVNRYLANKWGVAI